MTKTKIFKIAFICFLTIAFNTVQGQSNINVFVSQEGNLSFKVTKSGFYMYISQKGKITGYGALANGNISYDFSGRVEKIGATSISYDFSGRIEKIGTTSISYDFNGRVEKIGTTPISYNFSGNIEKFDRQNISYNFSGKVEKVDSSSISYNFSGDVEKISDEEGIIVFRPKVNSED